MSQRKSAPVVAEVVTITMNKTKKMVYGAVVAALYAVLTLAFAPISYGPVQFRISEALTVLPLLFDFAIPGLTIGCVVANFLGGFGLYDIVFGSLATLLGTMGTRLLRKKPLLAMLVPVLSNAIIVGSMLYVIVPDSPALLYNILTIGVGEFVICLGMGLPLYYVLKKRLYSFHM